MDSTEKDPEQVVCYCSGSTYQQLQELIDQGVDNLDRLSRITGACSGCGGCEYEITQLLAENTQS